MRRKILEREFSNSFKKWWFKPWWIDWGIISPFIWYCSNCILQILLVFSAFLFFARDSIKFFLFSISQAYLSWLHFFFNSGSEEYHEVSSDLDNILVSIKNFNITPESTRGFLPKVNWEHLASMHVVGRSGAECEARYALFWCEIWAFLFIIWCNIQKCKRNESNYSSVEDKS